MSQVQFYSLAETFWAEEYHVYVILAELDDISKVNSLETAFCLWQMTRSVTFDLGECTHWPCKPWLSTGVELSSQRVSDI